MDKKQFVNELTPKTNANAIFMVKYLAKMDARDGRSYLNVILTDKTGDIEARKWNGAEKVVETISKGDYVAIKGKVNLYQGRHQLIISEISKLDIDDVDESDYIPTSKTAPDAMYDELDSIIDSLDDVYIKDLLKSLIYDPEVARRLKLWSAGKSIHHAFQGGLLEHLLSCAKLAVTLSSFYPVNKNYVVAGAVIHDMCKIYELTDGPLVEYTEEGKLVGHLVNSIELLNKYASKIKGFPNTVRMHLKHILVSHHGEYEYGSPKLPQTSEAMLVHYIDLLDSKMNSFETAKAADKNVGHWTGFVRHLDRIIFKGELPTYHQYIGEESQEAPASKKENKSSKSAPKGDLKHSMAGMLKDFKVDK